MKRALISVGLVVVFAGMLWLEFWLLRKKGPKP